MASFLIKLCFAMVIGGMSPASSEGSDKELSDWGLVVAGGDHIELLKSNGTIIDSSFSHFLNAKAIAYDVIRDRFIVSDTEETNDTIYSVPLTKNAQTEYIISELSDDVQGLAIDPIEDILYWTDIQNRFINFLRLDESAVPEAQQFLNLSYQTPQDIVIDVCRRYIYWTNSNKTNPSIERARLNGTNHQIIIDTDLTYPAGITIDYKAQKLYWADRGQGVYYRIGSSNLDGTNRQMVYEDTHMTPFGIAVDDEAIYFTDLLNKALWRLKKKRFDNEDVKPERLTEFSTDIFPMGIVANSGHIKGYPDCQILEKASEKYRQEFSEYNENNKKSDSIKMIETNEEIRCLNGGSIEQSKCVCTRGFSGKYCEIKVCNNFCLRGDCRVSSLGNAVCNCHSGYSGSRCELNLCTGFCLNNGICSIKRNEKVPKCTCPSGFGGNRCQYGGTTFEQLCESYCTGKITEDILVSKENNEMCRCTENNSFIIVPSNASFSSLPLTQSIELKESTIDDTNFMEKNGIILILSLLSSILLIALGAVIYANRRKKPRIHKRYTVNKIPMHNQPARTTEHCEIVIEDCCNMNVCDTPCFEPPKLAGVLQQIPKGKKREDQSTLLLNDEEELY